MQPPPHVHVLGNILNEAKCDQVCLFPLWFKLEQRWPQLLLFVEEATTPHGYDQAL